MWNKTYLFPIIATLLLLFAGCVTLEEKVYPDGTADLKIGFNMKKILGDELEKNKSLLLELKRNCSQLDKNELTNNQQFSQLDMSNGSLNPYFKSCDVDVEKGILYIEYSKVPVERLNQSLEVEKGLLSTKYILKNTGDTGSRSAMVASMMYDKFVIEMPGKIVKTSHGEIVDNTVVLKGEDAVAPYVVVSEEESTTILFLGLGAIVVIGGILFFLMRR